MINGYYTSKEVAGHLGLTTVRVNQHAKRFGVKKFGTYYMWSQADIDRLKDRVGMRGRRLG